MNVGRRIGEIRAGRGLTQEQLAEMLDVTLRHLQAVEGGSENLTVKTLARIATLWTSASRCFSSPRRHQNQSADGQRLRRPPLITIRQRRHGLAHLVPSALLRIPASRAKSR